MLMLSCTEVNAIYAHSRLTLSAWGSSSSCYHYGPCLIIEFLTSFTTCLLSCHITNLSLYVTCTYGVVSELARPFTLFAFNLSPLDHDTFQVLF